MDIAGFMKLKKNLPVVFCLYDMRDLFDEKKSCRPTLEKYRWRLIFFFFSRHLPRNSDPFGNAQTLAHSVEYTYITSIPCSPSLFLEITQKPRVILDIFLGYYIKKQIFFVIFVSSFAALFL